jgi:hypothetical protein
MSGPNLWWVYDTDEKSFSTLPTGPFLLPGLFIFGFTVLWRNYFDRQHTIETIAGRLVNTEDWRAKHKRYRELVKIHVDTNGDFTLAQKYEYDKLNAYLNNPYGY